MTPSEKFVVVRNALDAMPIVQEFLRVEFDFKFSPGIVVIDQVVAALRRRLDQQGVYGVPGVKFTRQRLVLYCAAQAHAAAAEQKSSIRIV